MMAHLDRDESDGCEPSSEHSSFRQPTPPPSLDIKIEMVQPKIEEVDFGSDPMHCADNELTPDDVALENNDEVDSKSELAFIVGQERPTCSACGRSYKSKDSLVRHLKCCEKTTNEIVRYKCSMCPHETKWESSLRRHIKTVHPVGVIDHSTCSACKKTFKNTDCMKRHQAYCEKSNKGIAMFECGFCGHKTKWMRNLRDHIKRLHIGSERASCPLCGKSLKTVHGLKMHMKFCDKANIQIVKFKCFHCSHETKWKTGLIQHITRLHPIGAIERPTCPQCGKSYKNKESLKGHAKYCEKSDSGIVKHKCPFCFYETKWKPCLKQHLIEEHHPDGIIERPTCSACGKPFKNKNSLKQHIKYCEKWNNGIVMHKCSFCIYETRWKSSLTKHLKEIHLHPKIAKESPNCPACGQSFTTKYFLKKHLIYCEELNNSLDQNKFSILHHRGVTESPTCSACGNSFTSKYFLKKHMKCCEELNTLDTHETSRESYLNQQFGEKWNYRIVKCKCFHCSCETNNKNDMKAHIIQMHPVDWSPTNQKANKRSVVTGSELPVRTDPK